MVPEQTNKYPAPVYILKRNQDLIKHVNKDRHRLGLAIAAYAGLRCRDVFPSCERPAPGPRDHARNRQGRQARSFRCRPFCERDRVVSHEVRRRARQNHTLSAVPEHHGVRDQVLPQEPWPRRHPHTLRRYSRPPVPRQVQIERISELLGHAGLDTTMIYSHISGAKRKAVMG